VLLIFSHSRFLKIEYRVKAEELYIFCCVVQVGGEVKEVGAGEIENKLAPSFSSHLTIPPCDFSPL
jgi:hypothetical protein